MKWALKRPMKRAGSIGVSVTGTLILVVGYAGTAHSQTTAASRAAATRALEPAVQTSAPTSTSATATATAPAPASAQAAGSGKRERGSRDARDNKDASQRPRAASTASTADTSGAAAKSAAKDHLELNPSEVTGNRELPRVMYVVPWRRADPGDFAGRPPNSLLDEVLAPVDRDVFRRTNRYYEALNAGAAGVRDEK